MSFGLVCQQCKEPLQIDESLIDLAPSAYDMIAGTLPPTSTRSYRNAEWNASEASGSSRAAWEKGRLNQSSATKSSSLGKTPQRSPLPHESFVLLQDSVLRTIPPAPPSPIRSKKSASKGTNGVSKDTLTPTRPLTDDQASPSPLSHNLRSIARLTSLLSARTDVDHPLCAECTRILTANLQRQLDETKRERDGYIAFEKEIRKEKERETQGPTREEMEKKIERLKQEEAIAIEQLRDAERERAQLDAELRQLELDEKALEMEEAQFWRSYNDHTLHMEQQNSQLASLRASYAASVATLEKLERTNVYNDAFCIGHDGVFGTINGLRLGRVPGVPVEWAEINAAWGQTLLLLYTVARKLDFTFENYKLVPMGSFSRIEKTTADKATYELYGSSDLHLGRLLHNRRFDFAMVAFLDCLKHLMDYIKTQDATIDFPHQISKDKIGDVSVKLQFNQEEAWTRSLRHVLLALKICLKWATNGGNG